MIWELIREWWKRTSARRRLISQLGVLTVALALPGCVRQSEIARPDAPKPVIVNPPAPSPGPKPIVTAAQFGEDLAREIEAGTWEKTDKFFTDAVRACRRCGLDPELITVAFGEVGKNRPLDKAEYAAKARTIK